MQSPKRRTLSARPLQPSPDGIQAPETHEQGLAGAAGADAEPSAALLFARGELIGAGPHLGKSCGAQSYPRCFSPVVLKGGRTHSSLGLSEGAAHSGQPRDLPETPVRSISGASSDARPARRSFAGPFHKAMRRGEAWATLLGSETAKPPRCSSAVAGTARHDLVQSGARRDLSDAGAATAYREALKNPAAEARSRHCLAESGDVDSAMAAIGTAYQNSPALSAPCVALTSASNGRLWLNEPSAALRG